MAPGIFRRAFVRDYARAIGLEPDIVVREFLELFPDPQEEALMASGGDSAAEASTAGGTPATRLRYLVTRPSSRCPTAAGGCAADRAVHDWSSDTGSAPRCVHYGRTRGSDRGRAGTAR